MNDETTAMTIAMASPLPTDVAMGSADGRAAARRRAASSSAMETDRWRPPVSRWRRSGSCAPRLVRGSKRPQQVVEAVEER